MIDQIINALLQLLAFMLIPFVVYWIQSKSYRGFGAYVGLKKSNLKANLMALGLAALIAGPMFLLVLLNDNFQAVLLDPKSVTGQLKLAGPSLSTFALIVLTAAFKTSFTEELLFRGFIAKRLIAWLSMRWGNLVQALLFGIMHFLLFLVVTDEKLFLLVIFLIPTIGAFGKAYINEKYADGSIIPSWIAHATANMISYSLVVFYL